MNDINNTEYNDYKGNKCNNKILIMIIIIMAVKIIIMIINYYC